MADLSTLNVQALAESGSSMTLCYPNSRTPLPGADGKPSSFVIRGPSSPVAVELMRANDRAQMAAPLTAAEEEEASIRTAAGLVISCHNIVWEGRPAVLGDVPSILAKHKFLVSQITRHFSNGDNFLPKEPQG